MDLADLFLLALAFLGGALPVCAVAAWRYHLRRIRELQRQLDEPAAPEPRLAALEQALDSLLQQVDQLASGQEFLTRLIAHQERRPLPRSESSPQVNTPH